MKKWERTCFKTVSLYNHYLSIVHFRQNKSNPDRRFNSDPFPHVEEGLSCTGVYNVKM